MNDTVPIDTSALMSAQIEHDLARSAWFDKAFAMWFAPFVKDEILFHGARGEAYFRECGEFAKKFRAAPAESGDSTLTIFSSDPARQFFASLAFPPLPGGRTHKPTAWQMEKARKYLASRHNSLLSEKLADAEMIRGKGDHARADALAAEARKKYMAFADSSVDCAKVMSDPDAIMALAESNPPLFRLSGEAGKLLNARLKPDNFGIILGDQKSSKTTTAICLAIAAGKQVPTLFVSTGDETEIKIDARVATNLSCMATQPEYAGTFAVPVPDCEHNARGTCPINMSGVPRVAKDWKKLIEDGAKPDALAQGLAEGSRAIDGSLYLPCPRCFPKNDGTKEDRENRARWRSAVWWRMFDIPLIDRKTLVDTRVRFETQAFNGGLRRVAFSTGELSVEGLFALLDTLDRVDDFVPEVIVLDYGDLMKQKAGRSSDKDHDGMRGIWEDLRTVPFKLHNLLIAYTQTNGESDGAETFTKRMIGRSKKAADNCTWFATINSTIVERRAKVMRLSMLYAREGECDPEHQALCCQWLAVQDAFAFSMPIFCKIKNEPKRRDE